MRVTAGSVYIVEKLVYSKACTHVHPHLSTRTKTRILHNTMQPQPNTSVFGSKFLSADIQLPASNENDES